MFTMVMITTLHVAASVIQYAQDQTIIPLSKSKVLLLVKVSTIYSKGAWTYGHNHFVQHPKAIFGIKSVV
jgi:hypothetical protein